MYKVYQRLKMLWAELRYLNRKDFDNVSEKVYICRHELEGIKSKLLYDPFNMDLQKEETNMISHLQKLLKWEKSFLKQKAKCQWV